MQIWEIQRAIVQRSTNATEDAVVSRLMHEENIYVVLHMLLIFWVPAFIVLVRWNLALSSFNVFIPAVVLHAALLLGVHQLAAKHFRLGQFGRGEGSRIAPVACNGSAPPTEATTHGRHGRNAAKPSLLSAHNKWAGDIEHHLGHHQQQPRGIEAKEANDRDQ